MSHIVTLEAEITDLSALDEACRRLGGVEFVPGQKTHRGYGGETGDCEHAVRVKGDSRAYEIGLVRRADGRGYTFAYDPFAGGRGLEDVVGEGCVKLRQQYGVVTAARAAAKQGFRVVEQRLADGSIKLVASRG